MAEKITMPKLSDTMEEGILVNWQVKEGDQVGEGDILAEIETDKATMEYESPEDGTILKFVAAEGDKKSVGETIAWIGEKGESIPAEGSSEDNETKKEPSKEEKKEPKKEESKDAEGEENKKEPNKEEKKPKTSSSERVVASPLAKKLASEKGLDLSQVEGSGPHGRIIQRDVENFKAASKPSQPAGVSEKDQKIPLSMMRQTIAKRLKQSSQESPHFYLMRSARMEALLEWKQMLKDQEIRASVNDLLIFVVGRALRQHPEINVSFYEDHILQRGAVHVGFAVAIAQGLVTPVVRHADSATLTEISKQASDLIEKSKNAKLKPQDMEGGTFTISNLGMMGIERFTAIINPPQSAILAIGATQNVPVVEEDGHTFGVAKKMELSLSCDHRAIDGAQGAMFLDTVVRYIEKPILMLS